MDRPESDLEPWQWPEPHWNLSVALLLKGDYRQGWIEHEWRLHMKEFAGAVLPGDKPKWDGEELKGRTVLLTPELGYGNTIQFIRYVPLIADRGEFSRSILAGLRNSNYFDYIGEAANEAESDRWLATGKVQFVVTIPADFSLRLVRGEHPALLLEADATDPAATGPALSAVPHSTCRGL